MKLAGDSTGIETAVAKTTVAIYVQRSFYPLKIGEGTTDENGEATIEIPNGLPGDAKGSITLLARLDENEDYGFFDDIALPVAAADDSYGFFDDEPAPASAAGQGSDNPGYGFFEDTPQQVSEKESEQGYGFFTQPPTPAVVP